MYTHQMKAALYFIPTWKGEIVDLSQVLSGSGAKYLKSESEAFFHVSAAACALTLAQAYFLGRVSKRAKSEIPRDLPSNIFHFTTTIASGAGVWRF